MQVATHQQAGSGTAEALLSGQIAAKSAKIRSFSKHDAV
jgi:hypothetical protein